MRGLSDCADANKAAHLAIAVTPCCVPAYCNSSRGQIQPVCLTLDTLGLAAMHKRACSASSEPCMWIQDYLAGRPTGFVACWSWALIVKIPHTPLQYRQYQIQHAPRDNAGLSRCDARRPLTETKQQFPGVDFSGIQTEEDTLYPKFCETQGNGYCGIGGEPEEHVTGRGIDFLHWLMSRYATA